jgi:hypothetical protein
VLGIQSGYFGENKLHVGLTSYNTFKEQNFLLDSMKKLPDLASLDILLLVLLLKTDVYALKQFIFDPFVQLR